jgi:phage FluMu protein Com
VLIHFRCPHCEKLLAIGPHKGGAQINCPMCARPVTVPPRTEVEVPATTVVLPDLSPEWWLDAPAAAEAKPTPPPAPPTDADAWWLTAGTSPPAAEPAITPTPPPRPSSS